MGLKEEVEEILKNNDCYLLIVKRSPMAETGLQLPELEACEIGRKSDYQVTSTQAGKAISEAASSRKIGLDKVTLDGQSLAQGTASVYEISQYDVSESAGKIQVQCRLEKRIDFILSNKGKDYRGATLCADVKGIEKYSAPDEIQLPDLDSLFED